MISFQPGRPNGSTSMFVESLALPPGPEQIRVYVVVGIVDGNAFSPAELLADLEPLQAPEATQEVAFVLVQVNFDDWP